MAKSPSHKFGQVIGNLLENLLRPLLQKFCQERNLYLDCQGLRRGVRQGKKVTWQDKYGNVHDLDFVIEKEGSKELQGRPVAFIEVAWRRYTKHSRNKVQEIQGAILPIVEKFKWDHPFLGAVLAGIFTEGSLNQLISVGFDVAYLPYQTIKDAFSQVGINICFDENTPDSQFDECLKEIKKLSASQNRYIIDTIYTLNEKTLATFLYNLQKKLDRIVDLIVLIPMYGKESCFTSIGDTKLFLDQFNEQEMDVREFRKYELTIRFSNKDSIHAEFNSKSRVLDFLEYINY